MIIDTHTHFYDPARPEGVPWPKEGTSLYRTVLPANYKALAEPLGITGTIVVEASNRVADNDWVLDLAADDPFIRGLVGHVEPGWPDYAHHIGRLGPHPLFLGIRLGGQVIAEGVDDADFRRAMGMLIEHDLQLDLLANAEHLPAVVRLAAALPELRIVLDHVAHVAIDGRAPDAAWADAMRTAAAHENIYCKASGMVELATERPAPTDPAYYAPTLDVLWASFGEDRLIYGSNWPVCELAGTLATVHAIVKTYFDAKGARAAAKYFHDNAQAAYRFPTR